MDNRNRAAYMQSCNRGINRGNKLYEGHRLVLPEHQETLLVSRRTEHLHGKQLTITQEPEEQEAMIRKAVQEKCEVEIVWRQHFNQLKLSADQYAEYLHRALNPQSERDEEIHREEVYVISVHSHEEVIRCKSLTEGVCHSISIKDIISIQVI